MERKNGVLAMVLVVCLLASAGVLLLGGRQTVAPSMTEAHIVISEICAKNDTILADNDGKYRDYIELYNAGEDAFLSGFCLTDGKVTSEPFGEILLPAGAYRVVFLGDEVTGFALSASGGDCIQLLDPQGNIVYQTNTSNMGSDEVMVYGDGHYTLSHMATPGFSNDAQGLAAFQTGSVHDQPVLVISELLAENVSALPDGQGQFSDVVELHNTSDQPLALGGFWLSDSAQQRLQYRMPDVTLKADGYLVVCCDGENRIDTDGLIHTNFALSHGETLCLTDGQGRYVSLAVAYSGENVSLALTETGEYAPSDVTLGYPNTEEGGVLFAQSRINADHPLVISEVLLSGAGVPYDGYLTDVVELYNRSAETVSTQGWYLSDGGDPYAYPLPETKLKPGECMVIVCDKQTAGFGLSQGETVYLMGPDHLLSQPVHCTAEPGMSLSLCDPEDMTYTGSPVTLGYENTHENAQVFAASQLSGGLRISEVVKQQRQLFKGRLRHHLRLGGAVQCFPDGYPAGGFCPFR